MGNIEIKKGRFTDDEEEVIREHYPNMRNQDIVDQFLPHRNITQIKKKAAQMGLKKDEEFVRFLRSKGIDEYNRTQLRRFTNQEIDIIKRFYPVGGSKLCQKYLDDRSRQVINNKARDLDIQAPSTHPDLWRIDRIMQKKDNPYSLTVVYKNIRGDD